MKTIPFQLFIVGLISILLASTLLSDQFATTEDGKKVLLKDDGSWEYVKKQYDFRKTRWGMTKKRVKGIEQIGLVVEKEDLLTYRTHVYNLNCLVSYFFNQGILTRGKYEFVEEHTDKNKYIDDYNNIRKILMKEYGKSKRMLCTWKNKNSLYRNNPEDWGFALSRGDLTYHSEWETPDTFIFLDLYGKDYKVYLTVDYKSKKYLEGQTSPPASGARIKLIDWTNRWDSTGEYIYIEGILKNIGNITAEFVKVKVISVDAQGKLISIDDAYADPYMMSPGQESTFKISIRSDPGIKDFKIKLQWETERK